MSPSSNGISLALTLDDLPVHGSLPDGESRLQLHERMTIAFSRHSLPPVAGFLVGCHTNDSSDCHDAILAWLDSKNLIANHTFSHQRPQTIGADCYVADIERNDHLLAKYSKGFRNSRYCKYFRYPYLDQGDEIGGSIIRKYLEENSYVVVGASYTCSDWLWNQAYVRCLRAGQYSDAAKIGHAFVAAAIDTLRWSDTVAYKSFGRSIAQIGLLHMGLMQSHFMDELLRGYQKLGVRFLTLEEALRDPAYKPMGVDDRSDGANVLHSRLSLHTDLPAPPAPPAEWLQTLGQR